MTASRPAPADSPRLLVHACTTFVFSALKRQTEVLGLCSLLGLMDQMATIYFAKKATHAEMLHWVAERGR